MTERGESSAEQELAAWRGREHNLIAVVRAQILRLVVSERLRVEKELADVQTRIARLVGQHSDRRAFPPGREEAG